MKKLKKPGDNISIKTKKNEAPAVMEWINMQSNLVDSIRYLIENEIRQNGVRNLQHFIPSHRPEPIPGEAAKMNHAQHGQNYAYGSAWQGNAQGTYQPPAQYDVEGTASASHQGMEQSRNGAISAAMSQGNIAGTAFQESAAASEDRSASNERNESDSIVQAEALISASSSIASQQHSNMPIDVTPGNTQYGGLPQMISQAKHEAVSPHGTTHPDGGSAAASQAETSSSKEMEKMAEDDAHDTEHPAKEWPAAEAASPETDSSSDEREEESKKTAETVAPSADESSSSVIDDDIDEDDIKSWL